MQVGIVEPWHDEMPAQIDDFGLRTLQLLDIESLAYGEDAVSTNGDGFFTLDVTERCIGGHAGVNVGVKKNDVGFRLCIRSPESASLPHAHSRTTQQRSCHYQDARSRHSPTPASASMVSKIRFSPSSRPLESNHSCNVCAPPPDPPPPIAMASLPMESGMLASVEARCTWAALFKCESTARTIWRILAPACNSPAGRLPITTTSQFTPGGRFCADDLISAAMVSSSTARFRARRNDCSSRSISVIEVERISTFMLADSGIEFTEVPPRITPILKVVFGTEGTVVAVNVSIALARITMGLGAPKSLQECPPGPRTITSKRRLPRASATIVSAPAPSSTKLYAIESFQRGVAKMWRMPRRSPSPSSPTFPMNRKGSA